MATRKYKYCPFCHTLYESHHLGVEHVRSPFMKCSQCGGEFLDNEYKEWVTMNQKERDQYLKHGTSGIGIGTLIAGIFMDIALIVGFFVIIFEIGFTFVLILFAFFIAGTTMTIVSFFKNYRNFITKKYNDEILNSIDRCKNIEHANRLLLSGYRFYPISNEELQNNNLLASYNDVKTVFGIDTTESSEDIFRAPFEE